MKKDCENRYKGCRENAGFTQFEAAGLLHVSERSLSDYENGKTKVPDDIVASMAEIYNAPLLAWWHLRENSRLGKYLPEIVMPQTNGDMAFQLVLADDKLTPAVEAIKKIFWNGKIDDDEWDDFHLSVEMIQGVIAKLLSAMVFVMQNHKKEG